MVVDQFMCFGGDDAGVGASKERDVGSGGNSKRAVTIRCCSKSQVCQREQHTTLHTAAGIQMTRFYAHLGSGIALGDVNDLYTILPRKLVVQEKVF